jgi:hypothetical protein
MCRGGAHNPSAFRSRRQKFTLASRPCPARHLKAPTIWLSCQSSDCDGAAALRPLIGRANAPGGSRSRGPPSGVGKNASQRCNTGDIGEPSTIVRITTDGAVVRSRAAARTLSSLCAVALLWPWQPARTPFGRNAPRSSGIVAFGGGTLSTDAAQQPATKNVSTRLGRAPTPIPCSPDRSIPGKVSLLVSRLSARHKTRRPPQSRRNAHASTPDRCWTSAGIYAASRQAEALSRLASTCRIVMLAAAEIIY